ncbi:hypothetical protein GF373_16230, partial [bacterium]|nr:hypothetical protein [bacterium]
MPTIKNNSRHVWLTSLSILSLLLTTQSTVAQTLHENQKESLIASAWRDVSAPGEFDTAQQTTMKLCVDNNNQTGVEDGTVARPFRAIQQAIDSTLDGEAVIYVAEGEYNEHLTIQNKQIHLLGGFQGASANEYAAGQEGDFTAADPGTYISTITGNTPNAVVTLINARESVVDGFVIMGGAGRLINQEHQGGGVYCQGGSPIVSNSIIEGNDTTTPQQTGAGGGIYAINAAITIVNNTIQNNISGHGGGITIENGLGVLIQDNTIQQNTAVHYLGGGGISVTNSKITVTNNTILKNQNSTEDGYYGGGAGISLRGEETSAICSYNTIAKNVSVEYGAGLDIQEGAHAALDHELIYQNHRMEDSYAIGGTISVAGRDTDSLSSLSLINCTIADNNKDSYVGGNGIYAQNHGKIEVLNSIFWGNNQDDFLLEGQNAILEIQYSNAEESFKGEGNLSLDPAFANPEREDYHLKSMAGRWDPQKEDGMGAWVIDDVNSPCIDAGHSSSPWEREPSPNGGRVNMGCYGNTGEASLLYIPPPPTPRDPCRFPLSFDHHCVENRVPVLLHPQPDCPINKEVTVSFGMPFPLCMIADPKLIRVEDQLGTEIPAFVETLLPWRDLSTGTDFSYIRSALIQFSMTFEDTSTPVEVIIKIGSPRAKPIDTMVPVRDNWTLVDDRTFPAKYGVYEPNVYA